jgi:sirohydrochlorin cobaltochelatase
MQANDRKEALLVTSFGTTKEKARQKSIAAVETALAEAFPSFALRVAYTSHHVVKHSKAQDAEAIPYIADALNALAEEGFETVVIQALHLIAGHEYEKILQAKQVSTPRFNRLVVGRPLMSRDEDYPRLAQALLPIYQELAEDEALLLMGHGSTHASDAAYARLQKTFHDLGMRNAIIGTVEGEISLEDAILCLERLKLRKVMLMPLMLVAGEHAAQDMAGEDPKSWKSILHSLNYDLRVNMLGLGELEAVQAIYIDHVKEALEDLNHA